VAQHALVDTNVLYGAFQRRDQFHDDGLAIVRAADRGELPTLVFPDFVLAEVMNALTLELDHDDSMTALSMVEESDGFRIQRTPNPVWMLAFDVYATEDQLSFVDSILAAYGRERDVEYVYSFDTGFDSVEQINRLTTPDDPYEA
jgi:predicted nucleic acid-binding protein